MAIDAINGNAGTYTGYYSASVSAKERKTEEEKAAANGKNDVAAVYEKSDSKTEAVDQKKLYKPDQTMINKLKADADSHKKQLQDIVEKLLTKQGKTFDIANGKNLKNLYAGLNVDAKTRAQAQADISEDGYYGVKQTSQRIFDFAMALSGGDPDQMEKMRSAFEKGYKKATKSWGDQLPDICKQTYDAVQSKFDDYKEQMKKASDSVSGIE
ncbi:MAG: hypothetical protein J6O73_17535 [Lachnospiraceae bacterium]|nr:hypothetical protein [Lachnospiraceae bacterium]